MPHRVTIITAHHACTVLQTSRRSLKVSMPSPSSMSFPCLVRPRTYHVLDDRQITDAMGVSYKIIESTHCHFLPKPNTPNAGSNSHPTEHYAQSNPRKTQSRGRLGY